MLINGHDYTEPIQLETWDSVDGGGVYIIMYQKAPNNYDTLYIGESAKFDTRGIKKHEKIPCCKNHSNNAVLYISTLRVGNESDRCAIEKSAISICRPPCNIEYT